MMHRYTGILTYATDNIGRVRQTANAVTRASFSTGLFAVAIEDANAHTVHLLANRRFNYQARDSPAGLLAREKWTSDWFGRFEGPVYLGCPRIFGVPREIGIALICPRGLAFVVLEFLLGDTFYQFPCRRLGPTRAPAQNRV